MFDSKTMEKISNQTNDERIEETSSADFFFSFQEMENAFYDHEKERTVILNKDQATCASTSCTTSLSSEQSSVDDDLSFSRNNAARSLPCRTRFVSWAGKDVSEVRLRPRTCLEEKHDLYYSPQDFQNFRKMYEYETRVQGLLQRKAKKNAEGSRSSATISPFWSGLVDSVYNFFISPEVQPTPSTGVALDKRRNAHHVTPQLTYHMRHCGSQKMCLGISKGNLSRNNSKPW